MTIKIGNGKTVDELANYAWQAMQNGIDEDDDVRNGLKREFVLSDEDAKSAFESALRGPNARSIEQIQIKSQTRSPAKFSTLFPPTTINGLCNHNLRRDASHF